MPANRLYYHLKPYLPWRFRMALRRIIARRRRMSCQGVWPINEAASQTPAGWPGWPDGKKFAFVLTHDVEGPEGLAKCRQLMQLEMKHGFRSSFNFIPEGDYAVSRELREELTQNGFEVGVHDLKHDGLLYSSRRNFSEKAQCINRYLKDWGAKGFRSGFMLRNLEWLHELDIQYDASTFDTDPFEPQPDGAGTIFPFWVPYPTPQNGSTLNSQRPAGSRGYVELPYTLPQDSTLFLMLKESSNDIWKKKLDWIVAHNGMALLDVHPDYINFGGQKLSGMEYPSAWYEDFLKHIAQNYRDLYWNPLPHEIASWYKEECLPEHLSQTARASAPSSNRRFQGKRAAVVLYSYYASDPRPRREAETLRQAGMEVDVISLRMNSSLPRREQINGVNVYRVSLKRRRAGKLVYAFQYLWFLINSFFILSFWSLKRRYQLVHIHNMPDFLVFSALVPKLSGAKIILDLHDPMPELMMTIFGFKEDNSAVRLLKFLEKASIGFADHVLTVNLACKKIFSARSCAPEKIQVLMNTPDERFFKFRPGGDAMGQGPAKPFVIMYHGSIVERNGLDLAVEALRIVQKSVPGAELCIYGPATPFLDKVLNSARESGLNGAVRYLGPKPLEAIAREIEQCDVGIIPNRNNAFTEINTPTRIFEYLSAGKPVITPRAQGITDYFGAADLVYFELGNADDLARQLEYVHTHPEEVKATVQRGQAIYLEHCWSRERENFLDRVSDLLKLRSPL